MKRPSSNQSTENPPPKKKPSSRSRKFVPSEILKNPIPVEEAKERWPHRYTLTKKPGRYEDYELAANHYLEAIVDGKSHKLDDDAFVQSEPGKPPYIAKIIEIFMRIDNTAQFAARWYYRSDDTVIQDKITKVLKHKLDGKRVFYSDVTDDNPIGCLVSKINIKRIIGGGNSSKVSSSDFRCDMAYSPDYSTFSNLSYDLNLHPGRGADKWRMEQLLYVIKFLARKEQVMHVLKLQIPVGESINFF